MSYLATIYRDYDAECVLVGASTLFLALAAAGWLLSRLILWIGKRTEVR